MMTSDNPVDSSNNKTTALNTILSYAEYQITVIINTENTEIESAML